MSIRNASADDIAAIIVLFQQTILRVTAGDYTLSQRQVWAGRGTDADRWKSKIATQHFLVAEEHQQLLGFGSITSEGYLDVLYVHQEQQGRGIATRLLEALETWAKQQTLIYISTDASLTARPFFERKGYHLRQRQQHAIENETLVNFRMEKTL